MKLSDYFESEGRGSASRLAAEINAFPSDMSDWAKGLRPVPVVSCVLIEKFTAGAVTRRDLRPADWHLIWPELTEKA